MAPSRLRPDETRRPSAGRVLATASLLPALAVAGWLLAGLPLLMAGAFRPVFTVVLALPVIALLCWAGLRLLPEAVEATGRQTAGVLTIAVGSGVFNAIFHSEQLIVRRDPATYAQYTAWIAEHGSLPIPYQEQAFGGPDPALVFDSVGFFDFGGAVVPQFMPGPPMLFSAADWLGGLLLGPPVLGALAVLTVGGVAARLAGGRWAPVAALAFAVSMPILYTSRTTFSEIPSLILLFGGLSLAHDALTRIWTPHPTGRPRVLAAGGKTRGTTATHVLPRQEDPAVPGSGSTASATTGDAKTLTSEEAAPELSTAADGSGSAGAVPGGVRWVAGLAGLVFGLATLVRIDGLRDVLPVLAFAGLLVAMSRFRRPVGVLGLPLLGGLVVGVGLGFLAAYTFARPYLAYLSRSVVPLLLICGVVLVLTVVGTAVAPRLARIRLPRRLPEIGAALVALVMVGFAVRPWVQTVHRQPVSGDDVRTARFIEQTQKANGLPVDGTRLYFDESLYWVIWYVGVPVVVLATVAAAVLVRRLLRDASAFEWLLPLAVIGWTTVTTLLRPEITPDQPWAARRLVPVVIPGLIVLAVWGLDWVRDKIRRLGYGSRVQAWTAGVGTVLILVPPVITSIGTAFTPIERGERAAVEAMCRAIPRDASVLIIERVTADRFTQVVRGMCGVPAADVRREQGSDTARREDVDRLVAGVERAGRTPVILAADADQVRFYGPFEQVMALSTRQDERSLTEPPNGTWSLRINVWMSNP
ncbi:hypothetical protein [Nonomuraea endophytica]|uniref:Glycosyltransferase RgtA/B/C/D-like domain-containing protein n=1 Tax=Nonomuraea endophytica TaxID=714136 RepID=A0A7W7ZWT4_9ACTN|nr:hypothetical protein [Nonomuraea endophytica]MBB5074781.1 hypothetical protein [Nonomuraea endophytica]